MVMKQKKRRKKNAVVERKVFKHGGAERISFIVANNEITGYMLND